jgi:hypothetical protein
LSGLKSLSPLSPLKVEDVRKVIELGEKELEDFR